MGFDLKAGKVEVFERCKVHGAVDVNYWRKDLRRIVEEPVV